MVTRAMILFLSACLLSVGGAAWADTTLSAAAVSDATMIDVTGAVVTAGFTGGVADPVPLFVGSSGPVVFIMNMPGFGDTGEDPSLRRPGMPFGPMAGVRRARGR